MESRLNDMRILGMPVQFVVVVAISLALTIYFGAWAADVRIQSRSVDASTQSAGQFDFSDGAGASSAAAGLAGGLGGDGVSQSGISGISGGASGGAPAYDTAAQGQGWERFFLVACPLH